MMSILSVNRDPIVPENFPSGKKNHLDPLTDRSSMGKVHSTPQASQPDPQASHGQNRRQPEDGSIAHIPATGRGQQA